MSKQSGQKKAQVEGKWTLGYAANRSERLRQLQEFRDDCEKHHQRFAGSEIGPYLKRRALPDLPVQAQPAIPLQQNYHLDNGDDDVPAYMMARDAYERDKNRWLLSCKNVDTFMFECNKTYLPKLFVWIQERLEQSLRVRIESHHLWEDIERANPRDPLRLIDLIETAMSQGDIKDVGYEKYESLKDLFSSGIAMKQGQSLTEYEKVIRGRMRFIQSKDCWKTTTVRDDGTSVTECMLDEEFFVNLMFDNLSKVFDNAKIDYMNDIASSAVDRKTTFEDFVQYFSQIRSHSGQHVATTLATTATSNKKKRGKKGNSDSKSADSTKCSPDGSDDPRRTRPCSHCDGPHWDNHCPTNKKSKGGDKAKKKSNAPSSDEVKDARDKARKDLKSKISADTLLTFGEVKMGDLTHDQIQQYCAFVTDSKESA